MNVEWKSNFRSFVPGAWLIAMTMIFCGATKLSSFEFRSADPFDKGPLRVLFGESEDGYNIRTWSNLYHRSANKAFTDSLGTDTQPLTGLMFGKVDFKMVEMFPDALASVKHEFYNPLIRTARMHLRANYRENGIMIGGAFDMPVYGNQGRIGVRMRLPLKRIEIKKTDVEGVRSGGELQDVLSVQPVTKGVNQVADEMAILVRLDFAEALVQSSDRNPAFKYGNGTPTGVANSVETQVGGQATHGTPDPFATDGTIDRAFRGSGVNETLAKNYVLVARSPEGFIPRAPTDKIVLQSDTAGAWVSSPAALPVGGGAATGSLYYFSAPDAGHNYSGLADETQTNGVTIDVERRRQNQELKSNVWLVPIQGRSSSSGGHNDNNANQTLPAVKEGGALFNLKALSEQVTENSYEWLHDRGCDFETYAAEGVGDLDIDLFYEHAFDEHLFIEGWVGLRMPTAKKLDYITDGDRQTCNPYQMPLGNNGHWEAKVGGMVAWQPSSFFGIKGDAAYSVVIDETEQRSAVFRDSFVKNIGPRADAKVDWHYFVARADINFTHPRTADVTGLVGYEFFYKKQDKVTFDDTKVQSWMGRRFNNNTAEWNKDEFVLDGDLAAENTNSMAHRVRWEISYILSDWTEAFWNGSWSLAGKNIPREFDMSFGFNLAF